MRRRSKAFTLAELLISLAILGVIATFTIPKILSVQANNKYSSIAKEAAGTVVNALTLYNNQNGLSASTTMGNLTPYMNYVKLDSTSVVDDVGGGTFTCSSVASGTCLILHNGAMLWYWNSVNFAGTGTSNALFFKLDPDAVASTTTAIDFFIYTNGKVRSEGEIDPNTVSSDATRFPNTGLNPSWWSNWN